MRIFAAPSPGSGRRHPVSVALDLWPSDTGTCGGSGSAQRVRYVILAADLKKKKVVESIGRSAGVHGLDDGRTGACRLVDALSLPAGLYQLRASVTSEATNRSGSVYTTIEVPDYSSQPLAVGGIVVGSAVSPAADPRAPLPFQPVLERNFPSGTSLRIFATIGGRNRTARLTGEIQLTDAERQVVASVPLTLRADPPAIDQIVAIPAHAAGPYRITVVVSDASHRATREIAVSVR
jgi:hypothetical protein